MSRHKQLVCHKFGLVFLVCLNLYLMHLIYKNCLIYSVDQYKILEEYLEDPKSDKIDTKKYILLWTKFFGDKNWGLGDLNKNQNYFEEIECPETQCVITSDRSSRKVSSFDAIVFHGAETWILDQLPKFRSPSQLYVFSSLESPAETKHNLDLERNFFNLTMTYRLDSDIVWNYNEIMDIKSGEIVAPSKYVKWRNIDENFYDENLLQITQKKSRNIAWFVSHCNVISQRDKLAQKLQNFIDVSIFGKCGTMRCPKSSVGCDNLLNSTYKFYASFENSLCLDYVTEKFYDHLQNDIIPIAFGGANYTWFAPPKSYINANDFESVEELADYLKYLSENPNEYIKYFWWKKYYKIVESKPFCELCKLLHNRDVVQRKQVYSDIKSWWFKQSCYQTPTKLKF